MNTQRIPLDKIYADAHMQARVMMSEEAIAEYADAMRNGAEFPPCIAFTEDAAVYYLGDGFHRFAGAIRADRTDLLCEVHKGGIREAILWACGANAQHGIRRTNADKRRAVEILLRDAEWQRWNDSEIARVCNVSPAFVRMLRLDLEAQGEPQPDKVLMRRKGQIIERWAANEYAAPARELIERHINWDVVAEHEEPLPLYVESDSVHFSSDSGEWYTPKWLLELIVELMGGIDLDPCSNSKVEPNVPAKEHFTKEDDGLAHEWFGKVYMNPPYGNVIPSWINKAMEEFSSGRITEMLWLVPARTDTRWYHQFTDQPICFLKGRLKFINGEDKSEEPAPFPSMLVYFGKFSWRFYRTFERYGDIRINARQVYENA